MTAEALAATMAVYVAGVVLVGDRHIKPLGQLVARRLGSIDELVVMTRPLTATLALAKAAQAQP